MHVNAWKSEEERDDRYAIVVRRETQWGPTALQASKATYDQMSTGLLERRAYHGVCRVHVHAGMLQEDIDYMLVAKLSCAV